MRRDSRLDAVYLWAMKTPLTEIRNIGPAFAESCAKAGIHSAEELRAMGPDVAYAKLLQHGTRPHFIGYYVLVMGLQGRPWNDCKGAEKQALRIKFDALKSKHHDPAQSDFERMMDQIGVRDA